ncbi:MAG: hypothetical protein AB1765_09760 [Candidatus Hydrogenedentota bacterium]
MAYYRLSLTKLPVTNIIKLCNVFIFILVSPLLLLLKIFHIPLRLKEVFYEELEFIHQSYEILSEIEVRKNELEKIGFIWLGQYEVKGGPYETCCGLMLLKPYIGCAIIKTKTKETINTSVEMVTISKEGVILNTVNTKPGLLSNFPLQMINIRVNQDTSFEKMIEIHRDNLYRNIEQQFRIPLNNATDIINVYKDSYRKNIQYWSKKGYLTRYE